MNRLRESSIVELLRREIPDLEAVYLFGSAADPDVPEPRDVDIAVLGGARLEPVRLWEVAQRLALLVRQDVDLVDLRAAPTVLRLQVVTQGKLLFEADPLRRDTFEDTVFAAYARLNESRRAIVNDAVERGRIHG